MAFLNAPRGRLSRLRLLFYGHVTQIKRFILYLHKRSVLDDYSTVVAVALCFLTATIVRLSLINGTILEASTYFLYAVYFVTSCRCTDHNTRSVPTPCSTIVHPTSFPRLLQLCYTSSIEGLNTLKQDYGMKADNTRLTVSSFYCAIPRGPEICPCAFKYFILSLEQKSSVFDIVSPHIQWLNVHSKLHKRKNAD